MKAVDGSQYDALHSGGLNLVDINSPVSWGKHPQILRITNLVQVKIFPHPQDRISKAMDTFDPVMFENYRAGERNTAEEMKISPESNFLNDIEERNVQPATTNQDLSREDRNLSPAKRARGDFPGIERGLSNWVRGKQKSGHLLTDATIKEKARFFATTVGNNEAYQKTNSTSWLEKFKQKNGIGAAQWRASETNISDSGSLNADSAGAPASQTPNGTSPTSPNGMSSLSSDAESIPDTQQKQLLDMQIEIERQRRAQAQRQARIKAYAQTQGQAQALEAQQQQQEQQQRPQYPTPQPTQQRLYQKYDTQTEGRIYQTLLESVGREHPNGIIQVDRVRQLLQLSQQQAHEQAIASLDREEKIRRRQWQRA
jgi:hypothetical protein